MIEELIPVIGLKEALYLSGFSSQEVENFLKTDA